MTALHISPDLPAGYRSTPSIIVLGVHCRLVDGSQYCGVVGQLVIHAHIDTECVTVSAHRAHQSCLAVGYGRTLAEAETEAEIALRAGAEFYEEATQILLGGIQ